MCGDNLLQLSQRQLAILEPLQCFIKSHWFNPTQRAGEDRQGGSVSQTLPLIDSKNEGLTLTPCGLTETNALTVKLEKLSGVVYLWDPTVGGESLIMAM